VLCQNPPPTQQFLANQSIDHKPGSSLGIFQQRVLLYDHFYTTSTIPKKDRPIFFCPGGEGDVFGGYNHNGFMFEYGETHGALLVFPEHRYYGQTAPFGASSWNKTNLFYLTVDLALQDFRENIRYIRAQYNVPNEAPLITFGGSYPGDLAALLRVVYPNDVDAALASSAPLALDPSQYGFFRVVTESFAMQNPTCPDIMRAAFVEIQTLVSSPTMWLDLQLRLHLCDQQHDLHLLYLLVLNAFSTLVMVNYPYATGDFGPYPMKEACQAAVDTMAMYSDPLQAMASALAVVYNETVKGCFDINASDFLNCADVTGCGTGTDALAWDFQSCHDVWFAMSTNNVTDMFPAVKFDQMKYNHACTVRWGVSPTPNIQHRFNVSAASNIIFSNGLIDGWEPLGILKSPNPGAIVTIQYVGAHVDLWLQNARRRRSVRK